MTSTDVLAAGVIAALFAPAARLYVIFTALGVVKVSEALATTIVVRMRTTVANTMTNHREDFWICILIAFICSCGFAVLAFLSSGPTEDSPMIRVGPSLTNSQITASLNLGSYDNFIAVEALMPAAA
jgi:hypothetical protein